MTLVEKTPEIAGNIGNLADKYLGSLEKFCCLTGVAFLSLATLLFLKLAAT